MLLTPTQTTERAAQCHSTCDWDRCLHCGKPSFAQSAQGTAVQQRVHLLAAHTQFT